MEKFWLVAVSLFVLITLLVWRITRKRFKREHGKKAWKNWTTQTYYWQSAIYLSTGITFFILLLLKWSNVVTF